MNCQEFSEHATEIARAGVMDAAARDSALAHAEGCAACAAHLGREHTLSAALRATAESFNELSAPAHVETALLAAFRANREAQAEPPVVLPFAPAATPKRVGTSAALFGRRARAAFAATAIAASLVAAFVVSRAPQQSEPPRQGAAHTTHATAPSSTTPTEAVATSAQPSSQDGAAEDASANGDAGRGVSEAVARAASGGPAEREEGADDGGRARIQH
jgi:hypothetical protein